MSTTTSACLLLFLCVLELPTLWTKSIDGKRTEGRNLSEPIRSDVCLAMASLRGEAPDTREVSRSQLSSEREVVLGWGLLSGKIMPAAGAAVRDPFDYLPRYLRTVRVCAVYRVVDLHHYAFSVQSEDVF